MTDERPLPGDRIAYSPIVDRPPIRWPNDARVAFWVAPNVEFYEYLPPRDGVRNPWPRSPHPDVQGYAEREYGNRVGFWRMLPVLDEYDVRCTVSLNFAVLDHFGEIGEAIIERRWELMSHGIYNTRYLTTLTEDEERAFYRDTMDSCLRATGEPLKGMLGPAISNTLATPDLMAEAGLLYHTDWLHDDQPVPISVDTGRLISVPYSIELNDTPVYNHHYEADHFQRICKAQFDQLYEEGETSGRVMCLALHPYATGAPHRIRYLAETLDYILGHDGVWQCTAADIAEHYLAHHYEDAVAHAASHAR